MMVSQAAVHLRAPVVAEHARPAATMEIEATPTQDDCNGQGGHRGGEVGQMMRPLQSAAPSIDGIRHPYDACNSVWTHTPKCVSGSSKCMDSYTDVGGSALVSAASSCRVPPLPASSGTGKLLISKTNHLADECLPYRHNIPPVLPSSSHGAHSNQSVGEAQTWEPDRLVGHVLPQMEIDLDTLPIDLVPPPPPSQNYTRCPGFWKCIVRLHRRFGQRTARQQIDQGLRLYSDLRHEDAIKKWRLALDRINKQSDKYTILGYLCEAHGQWGGYREMIDYAFQQLDIANDIDNQQMRAEAYLNLSIGNGAMSQYTKSITYCEHALEHLSDGGKDEVSAGDEEVRTLCRIYIDIGKSYLGLSNFCQAIEYFDLAVKLSRQIHDTVLELQCYSEFGTFFTMLKDYEKGFQFHSRAHQLAKTLIAPQSSAKLLRQTELNLIQPLRKLGRCTDAVSYCQDAMKSAINDGDKPAQASSLRSYGDIFRNMNDPEKAFSYYVGAMNLAKSLDDYMGQCMVISGIAKTFVLMKKTEKMCDCRALHAHTMALKSATQIGNKMMMHHCHASMEEIYGNLNDEENEKHQGDLAHALVIDMNLFCGVCQKELGTRPAKIQVLPCSHIFHTRCTRELLKKQSTNPSCVNSSLKKRVCPDCRKSVMSRSNWMSTSSDDASTIIAPGTPEKLTGIPV